ncbi:MAG: proton-conducting transporter membrane subunit [Ectothiorhodospiraceae bacterium]
MDLALVMLLAPLLLVLAAGDAFRTPGLRPGGCLQRAEWAALLALAAAVAGGAVRIAYGPGTAALPMPWGPLALVRLDWVSVSMVALVAFIGWVVLRYARVYLDGEDWQGVFTAWLCATLAMVLLLVQAGHLVPFALAWIATSLCLHRLLLFYPERPAAQRAARKKFIVARLGDGALVIAFGLLAWTFGSGDIGALNAAAADATSSGFIIAAAGMLGLAALLKSAQFPVHGWLTEVIETPTPVSALLHAGVVNGGGFLLIRFADVMLLAPGIMAVLVLIGGFTALVGGLVMLAQPAVKASLAWSTIAQMGFMILQCGLGLFALALLHILAHSLYKAHAFLESGAAIERVAAIRRPGPIAVPRAAAVTRAFLAALGIYAVVGLLLGLGEKSTQAIVLGAILVLGVAYLLAQGFADTAPRALTRRTALYAVAATFAYFVLQTGVTKLTAATLPAPPPVGPLEWFLLVLTVFGFGSVAVAQALFPLWSNHPAAAGLRVHLSNGLYANAVFDRLLGGWSVHRKS